LIRYIVLMLVTFLALSAQTPINGHRLMKGRFSFTGPNSSFDASDAPKVIPYRYVTTNPVGTCAMLDGWQFNRLLKRLWYCDPVTSLWVEFVGGTSPGGVVASVHGRLGDVVGIESDYQAFYPRLSQAYANPSWVGTLAWSKIIGITGTPNGARLLRDDGAWVDPPVGAVPSVFGRAGAVTALESDYQSFYPRLSQTYANPAWLSSLAWSKITGVTGTPDGTKFLRDDGSWAANPGGVPSVFGRTGAVAAVEADYQSFYPRLSQTYANPAWLSSLAWSKITGVTGTPDGTKFLRDDGSWAANPGGVPSVFGRTGAVAAVEADYQSF
jgi:hypothetical protein